jgi:hypothetical protein
MIRHDLERVCARGFPVADVQANDDPHDASNAQRNDASDGQSNDPRNEQAVNAPGGAPIDDTNDDRPVAWPPGASVAPPIRSALGPNPASHIAPSFMQPDGRIGV